MSILPILNSTHKFFYLIFPLSFWVGVEEQRPAEPAPNQNQPTTTSACTLMVSFKLWIEEKCIPHTKKKKKLKKKCFYMTVEDSPTKTLGKKYLIL